MTNNSRRLLLEEKDLIIEQGQLVVEIVGFQFSNELKKKILQDQKIVEHLDRCITALEGWNETNYSSMRSLVLSYLHDIKNCQVPKWASEIVKQQSGDKDE